MPRCFSARVNCCTFDKIVPVNPPDRSALSPPGTSLSRRELLSRVGTGFGALGLAAVMTDAGLLAKTAMATPDGGKSNPLSPKQLHFAPRAKRVIQLLMNGGPSHVDTFDYKPLLKKYSGQRPAAVDLKTQRKTAGLMESPFRFRRYGQCGKWVSELFPHVAECVDDLYFIHSMYTDLPEHVAGLLMMNVGAIQPNRPSLGAWLSYGLGTENQDLPGFISLCHKGKHRPGEPNWSSSFLPGIYSRTFVDTANLDPKKVIPNIASPYLSPAEQRRQVDLLLEMNRLQLEKLEQDRALEARIQSLELTFRMQTAAPEAFDLRQETQATRICTGSRMSPPTAASEDAPSAALRRAACWPAGSRNGASASCSWVLRPTSPGTTTATFSGTSPRPRIAIDPSPPS